MASKKTIIKAFAAIKTIYNYFGKDVDLELMVDTWATLLQNYTDEEVNKGVFLALRVCKFAPVPADIIEQIENQKQIEKPCEAELWAAYSKALKDVAYYSYRLNYNYIDSSGISQGEQARRAIDNIWQSLPQELKIYLGEQQELLRLARAMSVEDVNYERNRFTKMLPILQKRIEDKKMLASITQNLLAIGNEK